MALAVAALALVAATPAETIPDLRTQGFFIEAGSDADPGAVGDAVAEARFDGGKLFIVVLAEEPPGGATTFSDAVLDDLADGTVFTVAPETIGYSFADDQWSTDQLDGATEAAAEGRSDTEVVEIFAATLTGESAGGFPWALVAIGLVVVAIVAGFVWWSRRQARARRERHLDELRSLVRGKVDDVANDIIELEDEVRAAGNARAEDSYEQAAAIYGDVGGAFERAATAEELVGLSNRLDEAIWRLDSAEAVLDGKPVPPRPEPIKPEPVESEREPPVEYQRRPTRRSSYRGPDFSSALMTLMAMGAMSGRRRRRSYSPMRRSGEGSHSRRSASGRRGRGGRRRRG